MVQHERISTTLHKFGCQFFVDISGSIGHQLAGVLGAPVRAGEGMYRDVQWKYFTADNDESSV